MTPSTPASASPPGYAHHLPSPALAPWVEAYWTVSGIGAPGHGSRVLPDGSNDIIVDLAGTPRAFVVGAMRRAEVVSLHGRVDLLGIRFRPGAALPFLGVPLRELTDREVALDQLWGRWAGTLVEAAGSTAAARRVAHLERLMLERVGRRRAEDELAARAVDIIRRTRGGIGVAAMAAALGLGERRLQRLFALTVGLSPKRLGRVIRFRHAVRLLERRLPAATVALDAGYADQAHFIREFKSLAGITPSRFQAERAVGIVQDAGHRGA
jgi:AraC-like DNA-binding protein